MIQVRFLRVAFCILSASAVIAACGSDAPERRPDPPEKSVWEQMQECGLTGQFRVTQAPMDTCDDWPRADEIVAVEGDGDAVVLRAGLVELAVSASEEACKFIADGCALTPASDDGSVKERYFAPHMEFYKSGSGARLSARAVDVLDKLVGPCPKAQFDMSPASEEGCNPVGEYEASGEAKMLSGACDLTWGPGTVTVTKDADGYAVDWAGTTIRGLTLDPATCTLGGSKGVAPDLWIYNSANRSAEIELSFADGALKGTVKDKIDGTTIDGKTCAGATFELVTTVPPPRDARALAPTCSEPPPPACGNGVCEAGETCASCDDCACGEGTACAPDATCRAPCTLQTEATACAAGERCSPVGSMNDPIIYGSDPLYCDAAGAGKQWGPCSKTNDCGAGLICHFPASETKGYCSRACGDGFPECKAVEEECGLQGDGSGMYYISSAVKGCERLVGPGQDCTVNECQEGLTCIEHCINNVCSTYCSKKCATNADCPIELPVCKQTFCSAQ